jgi:hypothetical protein
MEEEEADNGVANGGLTKGLVVPRIRAAGD